MTTAHLQSAIVLVALGALFGSAFGCGSSSDSPAPTGQGGSGASAGAAGKGGSGGKAGTGGSAGASGVGGSAGSAGQASCLAANGTVAACNPCLQSKCASEQSACESDAECSTLRQCDAACSDSACSAVCLAAHPTGKDKLDRYNGCYFSRCWNECAKAPGGCPFATGACQDCMDTKCCLVCTKVVEDLNAMNAVFCAKWCAAGDAACQNACLDKYPGASEVLLPAIGTGGCFDQGCQTVCK